MKQLVLFALPLLLAFASCKRDKAVWDSDWQAPILNDSLTLSKWVADTILTVNGGYYELSIDRTVLELNLSTFVKIPDTSVEHLAALSSVNLSVPPGTTFVNEIQEHTMSLSDAELKKVRVKSGGITITVQNPLGTKMFFTIKLPGVIQNGVELSRDFEVAAGTDASPSTASGFVELDGYEMDLTGVNGGSFNKIQSQLIVHSDPAGPTINISSSDLVKFTFNIKDLRLDYARGYFGSPEISDTISTSIDALNKITGGMIDLPAASLDLELVNGLKVNGKLMITQLKNTNLQGSTVSMTHPSFNSFITINSATGTESSLVPSSTSLHFNAGNSNLEQYLENHGALNEIGFKLQLNPWGNISGGWDEIFPQSSLKVNLKGNLPLNIGLSDLVLKDTFPFSFQQDLSRTHVESGVIWLDAANAFPLQGEVTLYLLDDYGTTIAAIAGTSLIGSSVYGTIINGVQQKNSRIEFAIPESAVKQLNGVTKLAVRLTLNTPDSFTGNSKQVMIPEKAFFGFKLGARLKVEAHL